MKKCQLFCAGWWPFIVLPLLLLLAFSMFQWRTIENDISDNAEKTVNAQGQGWAQAETYNRGRELLITGLAPDQQSRDALQQEIMQATGARTVEFVDGFAEAKPLRDPSVLINWLGNSVVLTGEVNNQASLDLIVQEASTAYGSERVVNQLQLSNEVGSLSIDENLFLSGKNLVDGAQISVNNDQVIISGQVETEQVKTQIGSAIAQSFNGNVINRLSVPAPAPAPVRVDNNNLCASQVDELLSSSKIEFATGKAEMNSASDALIKNIAALATNCSGAEFEVSGHTDSTGNYDSNVALSKLRAQAVVDRLVELQLDSSRFSVRGYGPDQPIADNKSAAGRAQNRRIEFNLKK